MRYLPSIYIKEKRVMHKMNHSTNRFSINQFKIHKVDHQGMWDHGCRSLTQSIKNSNQRATCAGSRCPKVHDYPFNSYNKKHLSINSYSCIKNFILSPKDRTKEYCSKYSLLVSIYITNSA